MSHTYLRSHFGAIHLMRPQPKRSFAKRTRWSEAARKIQNQLAHDNPLLRHFKGCSAPRCRRCRAAVNFTFYISTYPWLTVATTPEGLRYGCSVCAAAGLQGVWGTGAASIQKRSCLRRHEKSKSHQVAKAKLAGQVQEVNGHWGVAGRIVPSAAVMKKVRQSVRGGEAIGEQGVDGVGGRKKVRKIKFVLAEAYREIMRRFLKEAEAISLHQDARAGYLMMRFQASDVDMNKMIGLLGIADIAKDFRPSANGIKDATHVLIDRFWTPSYHNPYPRRGAKGKLKKRSRQQMALKVEVFDADAAADEQKAGRKLKTDSYDAPGGSNADDYISTLSNIKIFNKDTTHAARRIQTRTTKVDDFMLKVQQMHFLNRESMAQRIQHSRIFSERFAKNIQKTEAKYGKRVKDMNARKHRFESFQKPQGRAVLLHRAVLLTAEEIANERRSLQAGKDATQFLDDVDEETELQLGLMADMSDEHMILLRFNDQEQYESTELVHEAQTFLMRIEVLFDQGECWQAGYTKFMLDDLQAPIALFYGGKAKVIGGPGCPSEATKVRCLARMRNQVRLIREVIRAEFPHYELTSSFKVFSLHNENCTRHTMNSSQLDEVRNQRNRDLRRLAQFFDLESQELIAQFNDILPMARELFRREGLTSECAWRDAIRAIHKDAKRWAAHPTLSLLYVLIRLIAYAFSTSGPLRVTLSWLCYM